MIPFTVSFRGREDLLLLEKLKAEAPGILARLVVAGAIVHQDGFETPDAVRIATQEYRTEEDPLAEFLNTRCEFHPNAFTSREYLYGAYLDWADKAKEKYPRNKRTFYDYIRNLDGIEEGWQRTKGQRARGFNGIGLVSHVSHNVTA